MIRQITVHYTLTHSWQTLLSSTANKTILLQATRSYKTPTVDRKPLCISHSQPSEPSAQTKQKHVIGSRSAAPARPRWRCSARADRRPRRRRAARTGRPDARAAGWTRSAGHWIGRARAATRRPGCAFCRGAQRRGTRSGWWVERRQKQLVWFLIKYQWRQLVHTSTT